MWLLIGIIAAGIAINISFKNIGSSRSIGLDRGAMLKAESKVVICTNCQTKMKRQKYGQQCPNCKKSF
jgi:uncharacterized CHY-type Zn-finger protein